MLFRSMLKKTENNLETANIILALKENECEQQEQNGAIILFNQLVDKYGDNFFEKEELKKKGKTLIDYNKVNTSDLKSLDFLNCPISLNLMKDPIMTSEGHTYDKMTLEGHFKSNGNFDPCTRKAVLDTMPNRAVKKAITENYKKYIIEQNKDVDYRDLNFEIGRASCRERVYVLE